MKKDIFSIVIIILLTFFFWKHIPNLQFIGEGFYYFIKIPSTEEQNLSRILQDTLSIIDFPLAADAFALAFFNLVEPIFKGGVNFYFWLLLVSMLLIDVVFFYLLKIITGNKIYALITTLLFSLSYIANFDMFSSGGYQYFAQRGILLLPLLAAFGFLILSFQSNFKWYMLSLFFYLLAICMGFFGSGFLPPFIFYPLLYLLINFKKDIWYILRCIFAPLPFLIGNILIIRESPYFADDQSLVTFLLKDPILVLKGLIHQLSVLTLPIGVPYFLSKPNNFLFNLSGLDLSRDTVIISTAIFLIALYFSATIFIWRQNYKWRVIILTAIASLISISILNLYKNSAAVMVSFESFRYFYYSYVFVALFWGLFLSALFSVGNLLVKILVILFLMIWFTDNYQAIQRSLRQDQWRHDANKDVINMISTLSSNLKKEPAYVYVPASLAAYGSDFVKRYYSHPDGQFLLENHQPPDYLKQLIKNNVNIDRVYLFHFDEGSSRVVDNTKEIRAKLKEIKEGIR